MFQKKNRSIRCTWCGSKSLRFVDGEIASWSWKYSNKDGSPDRRVRQNYQVAGYRSVWVCKKCGAESQYDHDASRRPSKMIDVWRGEMLNAGRGVRKVHGIEDGGYIFYKHIHSRKGGLGSRFEGESSTEGNTLRILARIIALPFKIVYCFLKTVWMIVVFPGLVILWFQFYFPTEWGKNRNVARGGRAWRNRAVLAPVYALLFYFLLVSVAVS